MTTTTTNRLDSLRLQIDTLDAQIASLLAKRQSLVKEAALVKHECGEGAVSKQREQALLDHGHVLEQKFNLPQGLMQDILRRILRESYLERGSGSFLNAYIQSKQALNQTDKAQAQFKVVIVGGNGGMGRFFKRYLEGANYEVKVVELDDYTVDIEGNSLEIYENSTEDRVKLTVPKLVKESRAAFYLKQAQWCIVSVPIDKTVAVIQKITPFLTKDCILSDLTSVKVPVVQAMEQYHQGPILALHPMFGPDTFSLVKQVVVACCTKEQEKCAFIIEQLKLFGAKVVEVSPQEHDESMRIIQALRHFTTIVYGNFLEQIANNTTIKEKAVHQDVECNKALASTSAEANTDANNKVIAKTSTAISTVDISENASIKLASPMQTNNAFSTNLNNSSQDTKHSLQALLELSSPIYRLELMMVGRLFAQDPYLYYDIISANFANLELIQQYITCAQQALDKLKTQQKNEFIHDFIEAKDFFGVFAETFLKESREILALAQDTYPV